uniref:HDC05183 n=1 Tax=Drosophila melanogaster TaxID=7227 RepID=Q6IGU6_DROME|nr:TPA_inf: HDC05183 [Drosophila melanogaster]
MERVVLKRVPPQPKDDGFSGVKRVERAERKVLQDDKLNEDTIVGGSAHTTTHSSPPLYL